MQNRITSSTIPYAYRSSAGASCCAFRWCLIIALALLAWPTAHSAAPPGKAATPGIEVQNVTTTLREGLYYLDAQIQYQLSPETIEALQNGVRLNFTVELRIFTQRYSWLRREKANLTHRFTLRYHALSQQYSLHHSNTEAITNFLDLDMALANMGILSQIPLIDSALLDANRDHFLEIRSRLEIESLPLPLRSMAYFNQGWILNSNWSVWALKD